MQANSTKQSTILHVDLNNFYASVERVLYPELIGKPLAVCGDKEARHGIVLAKCELAKAAGVKTGDTIWQAQKKCPALLVRPPRFAEYVHYSKLVRNIYAEFTDYIEPFGIDECWLDVSKSQIFGSGEQIAQQIQAKVKELYKLTVSIGVSFNKVFAKLASDLKKPDAITTIYPEEVASKVYPLAVENLLFVGRSTKKKLQNIGIFTIGDLAAADCNFLERYLGKWGKTLYTYACGNDTTPVRQVQNFRQIQSIGNSVTYYKDLNAYEDIKRLFYALAESVSLRLQEANVGKATTLKIYVKDRELESYSWQKKIEPTMLCEVIAKESFTLFRSRYYVKRSVRLLGIAVSGFTEGVEQMTIEQVLPQNRLQKLEKVEETIQKIRKKHGYTGIQRGILLQEEYAKSLHTEHLITPGKVQGDIVDDFIEDMKIEEIDEYLQE